MAKTLSSNAQSQLDRRHIRKNFYITINDVKNKDVISYTSSFDRQFGVASMTVDMLNNDGKYSMGSTDEIEVGDEVKLVESFGGDSNTYTNFTGYVRQRAIRKLGKQNIIILTCLDFIVKLEETEIEKKFEAAMVQVTNETLVPASYLPDPNTSCASVFDFANNNLVMSFPPIISFYDKINNREYIENDPGDIIYETGQLIMGSALNVVTDWDIKAKSYYHYTTELYIEDILEDIICEKTGYDNYLFGCSTKQELIDTHLTETFLNTEASSTDTLTPNLTSSEITIETYLTSACVSGVATLNVNDTTGFPNSGSGELSGNEFTWTGKTGTTLTGCSSVLTHGENTPVKYTNTYEAGQAWYTMYNNLITTLTASDFTITGGASFQHFDKRNGRLIIDKSISVLSTVTCNINYSYKTIQATGIQIPKMEFNYTDTATRFEAVKKLRERLAPNFLIRTIGDSKIWASYISQKTTADYILELPISINHAEDTDIYTRTKFYGVNNNPTNLVFGGTPDFTGTGETYISEALNHTCTFVKNEGNWRIYDAGLNSGGFYTVNYQPRVRINGVTIDNQLHTMAMVPVTITTVNAGVAKDPGRFHATIHLASGNIDPSYGIYFYNAYGMRPDIGDTAPDGRRGWWGPRNVNYTAGEVYVQHQSSGSLVLTIATATYRVYFSTSKLQIDNSNGTFKIDRSLIPDSLQTSVTADFEYITTLTEFTGNDKMIDGRYDTQSQQIFYIEPPSGFILWQLDIGSIKEVQAIDILSGFFKPADEISTPDAWSRRKFDMNNLYTLKYSSNAAEWYNISNETQKFRLMGGESVSFDRDTLGEGFEARYFQLTVEDLGRIEYGEQGVWCAAFTEIMIYGDLILMGECKLIPTTELTLATSDGDTTVNVVSTEGF